MIQIRFMTGNEDFFDAVNYQTYRWPDFVGNLSVLFPDIGKGIEDTMISVDSDSLLATEFMATSDTFDPILTPNPQLYDVHVYQTPSMSQCFKTESLC